LFFSLLKYGVAQNSTTSAQIAQKQHKMCLQWHKNTSTFAPLFGDNIPPICMHMIQNNLQSLIRQGVVKQVPLQFSANQIRWGHPDGYFLKSNGQKSADHLTESHKRHCNNHPAPNLHAGNLSCHVAMAMAFFGERPTFTDRKGKPYVGICHHLVPNLLDYRPANLLCWLTYSEHHKADNRRRALEKVVPEGNLNGFDYAILRELQDPRTMTDADFDSRMEYLRFMYSCDFDPRIFTAADFHHFFAMPLEDFKTFFAKYKDPA